MNPTDVSAHNAALFEEPARVDDYVAEGLWPVEAALIGEFFVKPPASVLDIGCGTGRTTVGLAARGYSVVAIDLSESMIDRARALQPSLDFRVMDASRLSFDDESFDAVLFSFNGIDLIYPETARIACLGHVNRVLRAGGSFVFSSHSLLGHVLCGRPFATGAWRDVWRFCADQIGNPVWAESYFRVQEGDGELRLWTYAARPGATERQLRDAGFTDISVRTLDGRAGVGWLGWRTLHTYFGARKMARPREMKPPTCCN